MAFTPIADNLITVARRGPDLHVSWTSALSAGTWFQGYVDGVLAWTGTARDFNVPLTGSAIRIDVGSVASIADRFVDYSASLPALPAQRVTLTWQGGTYLKTTIAGYHVQLLAGYGDGDYGEGGYGGPILATIPAYVAGVRLDGYGLGGYGEGVYGMAASHYSWTSDRLPRGTRVFGVMPFDAAGNLQGSPSTTSKTIAAPPRPPSGLAVAYNPSAHTATLTWTRSLL